MLIIFQQLLSGNVTKINEINNEDIAMDVENILYQLNLERILDDYGTIYSNYKKYFFQYMYYHSINYIHIYKTF